MLLLSNILLSAGDNIHSFEELKSQISEQAVAQNALYFNVDIEPPNYPDRPQDWHDQLNLTFEFAR